MNDHADADALREGLILFDLFKAQPDLMVLAEAEDSFRRAAGHATEPAARGVALELLGRCLRQRHAWTSAPDALDGAVDALTQACAVLDEAHPWRRYALANLGNALADRFDKRTNQEDLLSAERAYRSALDQIPPGHPDRGSALSLLATVLPSRYDLTCDLAYLHEAARLCREAALLPCDDHNTRARIRYQLAVALLRCHYAERDPGAVRQAVACAESGLGEEPDSAADRAMLTATLGSALRELALIEADLSLTRRAVACLEAALELVPTSYSLRNGFLGELVTALDSLFRSTGDIGVLDRAIAAARETIWSEPDGSVDAVGWYVNLGNLLVQRHGQTNDLTALDQAVDVYAEAASRQSPDEEFLPSALASLGSALTARHAQAFDSQARREYLANALATLREAAAAATQPGQHRSFALTELASALRHAFSENGDVALLDEAQELLREVLSSTPGDSRAYRVALLDLAAVLSDYPLGSADRDQEAESALRSAVSMTDPAHVDYRQAASSLASYLGRRYKHTGDDAFLREALAWHARLAARSLPAGDQVRDAVSRAELHAASGNWPAAADAYAEAVSALPGAVPRASHRADRAHSLSQFFALSCNAAAAALNSGDPLRAIDLLEAGRGVLMTQSSQASELRELATRAAPAAAMRLAEIDASLDSEEIIGGAQPGSAGMALTAGSVDAEQRAALERERAELVCGLGHAAPGYDAGPQPATDLLARIGSRTVVVVNASKYRCDAIVLSQGDAHVIPLPRLQWDVLVRQVVNFIGALLPGHENGQAVSSVLAWLWHAAAQPILTALGLTTTPPAGEPWRRVWWCPTGPLTFLPIHAAGLHPARFTARSVATSATIDLVVSTYTPTIRALDRSAARRQADGQPQATRSAFAVGISKPPGFPPIPGVDHELGFLRDRMPAITILEEAGATRERIIAAIGQADWFHFAGHCRQDPLRPNDAILIPYDIATAGPITTHDVATTRRQPGELAYLSACETARSFYPLADEAAHIAGAFQSAGFRQVIGTAWPARDITAMRVADRFYQNLTGQQGDDAKAISLHHAVRSIRREMTMSDHSGASRADPLLWAPFMHFGP